MIAFYVLTGKSNGQNNECSGGEYNWNKYTRTKYFVEINDK